MCNNLILMLYFNTYKCDSKRSKCNGAAEEGERSSILLVALGDWKWFHGRGSIWAACPEGVPVVLCYGVKVPTKTYF